MVDPLLIGMDLGTTNGKVACYTLHGELVAQAEYGYPTRYPAPGEYEQDPAEWIDALTRGLRDVCSALDDDVHRVAAMAVSNFGPGLVIVDPEGVPLTPCPTWQDDRCSAQGERLMQEVGLEWIGLGSPRTGFPARVLWAVEERPEIVRQAHSLMDIKGYLLFWLTGKPATDPSSGPGRMDWFKPAFEYAGWKLDRLPRVVPAMSIAGHLRRELALLTGLPSGLPVFTGLNDGAATTLGSGVFTIGQNALTLATNGVARVVTADRLDPVMMLERHLFSWPFIDGQWITGGFTFSGASSLQWLADQCNIPRDSDSYDALLAQAEIVPAGSRGVLFLPYLGGRGTPAADPNMKAAVLHLTMATKRAEIVRAVLEGTGFAILEIYLEFTQLQIDTGSVHISGGGAKSKLWRQIVSDILGKEVVYTRGGSTLGSAVIAAVGLGVYPDVAEAVTGMVNAAETHVPIPEQVSLYRLVYDQFVKDRDRNKPNADAWEVDLG